MTAKTNKTPDLNSELRYDAALSKVKELRSLTANNKNVTAWFDAVRSTGMLLNFLTEEEYHELVLKIKEEARTSLTSAKNRAMLARKAEKEFQELYRSSKAKEQIEIKSSEPNSRSAFG